MQNETLKSKQSVKQQMNRQFYLIVVYGIPGSGKTTFCETLQNQYIQINKNNDCKQKLIFKSISIDNIESYMKQTNKNQQALKQKLIKSIHNKQIQSLQIKLIDQIKDFKINRQDFNEKIWKESRNFVKQNINSLFQLVILDNKVFCQNKIKYILVIEDDFLLNSQRKPYRRYASEQKIKFLQIMIENSLQIALQNNQKRRKQAKQNYLDPCIIQYAQQKIQFDKDKSFTFKINPTINNFTIYELLTKSTIPQIKFDQNKKQQDIYVPNFKQIQQIGVRKLISSIIKDTQLYQQLLKNINFKNKKQLGQILAKLKKKLKAGDGPQKFKQIVRSI